MDEKIVIYTDGGSRGNPGPAAAAAVIGNKFYTKRIGETTNNVAEYQAIILALEKFKQITGKKRAKESKIEIRSDSELVINQLNGKYKIKDKELEPLFLKVWNLKQDFQSVQFVLIPRDKNRIADKLVNQTLDSLF